jgi:VWFA-related protein
MRCEVRQRALPDRSFLRNEMRTPLLVLIVSLAVPAAATRAQERQPTFSARAELVVVRVSVMDGREGFVSGLEREAFRIYEDGARQEIDFFSREDLPVTVGLVVDNSGSMGPKREMVSRAALAFARSSNPLDEMFLVNFNEHTRLGLPPSLPFTSDVEALRAALTLMGARGRTGLYDAVAFALEHADRGSRDQKALIVVSDGGDNASAIGLDELLARAKTRAAVIYTLGVFDRADPDGNAGVLRQLAETTGGVSLLADEPEEAVAALEQFARDIRHSYTIGYTPATAGDGRYHALHVVVQAPGYRNLNVRFRRGYLSGTDSPSGSAPARGPS